MREYILVVFLFIYSASQNINAQEVQIDNLMAHYQSAIQKFNSSSYTEAYNSFLQLEIKIQDRHSMLAINTTYYKTLSAMQLFHNDAVFLMENFLLTYPNSTLFIEASRNLADYYYQKRDYINAVSYYQNIDISQLRKKFRDNFKFKYAYSLFEIGEMKKAAFEWKK